ncbi:MAG: hypothetical protein ABI685_05575 [Ferruginibacter sp.]
MKKYILILTLLLGSFSMAFAQEGNDVAKQEKIQALYVAYVTQQLQLTPEEAQKFWPLHTQFANELKAVDQGLPELKKEEARLNIKKKYQENFIKVLGTNRCERFFKMSDEFKRKLRDRLQKQDNNQQRQRPDVRRGQ